jgi:hypothetical protein
VTHVSEALSLTWANSSAVPVQQSKLGHSDPSITIGKTILLGIWYDIMVLKFSEKFSFWYDFNAYESEYTCQLDKRGPILCQKKNASSN